jgi:Mn2+/Fe2+ NRAMP family transporter
MVASVNSTYTDIVTTVFTSTIAAKAWFASAAFFFALIQVATGARIFGKLKRFIPLERPWPNRIHRWSGRLAILCTLPVAFHCIFILGFRTTDARVLAHSIFGSFVYGVIAVKVFFVHDREHPRWTLPLVGGSLFAVLVTLWATSGLWYFTHVRFGF